ncbi:MAG: Hsp70 family protein, partial [Candidatus Accumulibacter sp.]|nr:Hsp70 family protein [Accumulibacter sp.]
DANGILHVSAKDKATGKENKIKIQASSGLSEEEVQRMVQDAELHAEEDRKAHELADARNQCDGMIHTVKKSLTEYGDKLADNEKESIERATKEAEEAIRGNDIDVIKAKTEALGTAAQKLGEKMYAEQQAQAGAAEHTAGGDSAGETRKDDSDVVDAEFTEVKDKK